MTQKAFKVVREDGKLPFKYGYQPFRNIFLTRGEAELCKVSVKAYNLGVELIIKESSLTWETSPER